MNECLVCRNCGWICETHPLEAWPCEFGCGAGEACACNPELKVPFGFVSLVHGMQPQ